MQLFYTSGIEGDHARFDEQESRHIVQVLRRGIGDTLHFIDGMGGLYQGAIEEATKKSVVVRIRHRQLAYKKKDWRLTIALAPPKSIDRFEWFLEKATEIGVDTIVPVLCQHSERTRLRIDRLQKVVLSAAKQSQRAYLPKLAEPLKLSQWWKRPDLSAVTEKYIAWCSDEALPLLQHTCQPHTDVVIMIGPEGDFSPEEIREAEANGFRGISLGDFRYRTETAGIMACHTINLINQKPENG